MAPILDESAIRTQQGVDSTTWTRPPFYATLTIPQLYEYHAERSPEHPVLVYEDDKGLVQTLRNKEVFHGIRRAAAFVQDSLGKLLQSSNSASAGVVVGILATTDFPTYFTLMIGIMYLGHIPFPISVRNSAPAVAQLLQKTSTRILLVSSDSAMQRVAQQTTEMLSRENYMVALRPLPVYTDLYGHDGPEVDVPMVPPATDATAVILHSSGSTSFPTPIPLSHNVVSKWVYAPYFGELDLCGTRISMHCVPMFHLIGVLSITYPVGLGAVISVFRPSFPPISPTPETVLSAVAATKCNGMISVPAFLEVWARDPTSIAVLRSLTFILFSGAPLSKDAGDSLVQKGVNICIGYGATETGAIMHHTTAHRTRSLNEWMYFTLLAPVEHVRVYQDGQPGIFELVVIDSPAWPLNVTNATVNGRPAYATNDLMEEHPTDPKLFRVYGRADDQIVLSTGEKTNPVPMEEILTQDPNIHAAIIFGRGRAQNGMLVQPLEPFDPHDQGQLEAFRNKIWPTVERANTFAPSHSRVFKEMILVTTTSKPFQFTPKGTPRRQASLADYAEEVEILYQKADESSRIDVSPPLSWSEKETLEYVRAVVEKVVKVSHIEDEDDLFQQGCDSLQATWMRNSIMHALRETTKISVNDIPQNFVYLHPTVASLSTFLHRTVAGERAQGEDGQASQLSLAKGLLEKYGTNFPTPQWHCTHNGQPVSATKQAVVGATVMITGTTGRLGSHLLVKLLDSPDISQLIALNREPTGDATKLQERQREALRAWGLDGDREMGTRVRFLVGDLALPFFGLDESTYEELLTSVTVVIHNAWRVDLNVLLQSFEPLIAGTRNLIDFALSSTLPGGPKMIFVSSISSLSAYFSSVPARESLEYGPEFAVGSGYGLSKWVAEQIIGRATGQTGLRATSVRVGQLCGDSRLGSWSTKEWVPVLVRASQLLGCVPARDDTVSWVPTDLAALALLDMVYCENPILHLVSPRAVSWNEIFGPVAAELGLPIVPYPEWLEKMRKLVRTADGLGSEADGQESALGLVEFFQRMMPAKENLLSTDIAVVSSKTVARLGALARDDVARWLEYWERVGFVKA